MSIESRFLFEEPSPYQDNRAIMLQHAMERRQEVSVKIHESGGSYKQAVPPENWNPARDTHEIEDYVVDVNKDMLHGIQNIIDSLITDLYDTGFEGQQMVADVVYYMQKKNGGMQ